MDEGFDTGLLNQLVYLQHHGRCRRIEIEYKMMPWLDHVVINYLRAKCFRGNININLYLILLHIEIWNRYLKSLLK